ncbi:MAG: universal stress protein [Haloplanus sp.]
MTVLVPFDGSELAEAALVRAASFGAVFDDDILALSVIPASDAAYAREQGWLGRDDPFDRPTVVATLHTNVTDLCPSADFRHTVVEEATPEAIATRIREVAAREDAGLVVVGSDNAGRVVTGVASVGQVVATNMSYDVVVVRQSTPSLVATLRNASPPRGPKSDFYFPQRRHRDEN